MGSDTGGSPRGGGLQRRGHGDYLWAKVLFPMTMLSIHVTGAISIPFIALAILQTPLYGVLLGLVAKRRPGRLRPISLLLAAGHAAAVALCFLIPIPDFS